MKCTVDKIRWLFVIVFLLPLLLSGQSQNEGTVRIHGEPAIDSLVRLHVAYNQTFPTIPGYRIQIFMESGNRALANCEEVEAEFLEKYEDIPTYITFSAPYYRVRVGDFRTRLEAEKFLQRINRKYPNAWVIKDEINLPDLPTIKSNSYE